MGWLKRGRRASAEDDSGAPVLITRAQPSREEQINERRNRYLFMMAIRFPILALGGVAYMVWDNVILAIAIIVISVPLPWFAVVSANDSGPRREDRPRGYSAGYSSPYPMNLPPAITGGSTGERRGTGRDERDDDPAAE